MYLSTQDTLLGPQAVHSRSRGVPLYSEIAQYWCITHNCHILAIPSFSCSANLHELADLLIRHGVVNAINTDGGGSNTLVEDGLTLNYPSDHWLVVVSVYSSTSISSPLASWIRG